MNGKQFYIKYRIPIIVVTALVTSSILAFAIDRYVLRKGKKMKPIKIKGSYKANGCDELHAFQSTHGKIIGGMNTKVEAELKKLYEQGINPEVVDVEVNFDLKNMTSNWEVTIDSSKDGKAYVGFTSRGSSGNASAFNRAIGIGAPQQSYESLLKVIKTTYNEPNAELKITKDWIFNFDRNGKILGKCPTRQIFYSYTRPNKYPSKK
jgi:hypothetical protein